MFTSLVATAIAYLCWFGGLARLRAATVGVVGLLNPVTGVLLGAAVLGERLTVAQVGGIALVLVGILATTRTRTSAGRRLSPGRQHGQVALGVAAVPPLLGEDRAQAA